MTVRRLIGLASVVLLAFANPPPSQAASARDQYEAGFDACDAAHDFCKLACEINNANSFSGWLACDIGCDEKLDACIKSLGPLPARTVNYSVQNQVLTHSVRKSLGIGAF